MTTVTTSTAPLGCIWTSPWTQKVVLLLSFSILFQPSRTSSQTSTTSRTMTTTTATVSTTNTPVSCQFSDWSEWGKCSRPCNGGNQTRTRVVAVAEQFGGASCVGDLSEQSTCNMENCSECIPGREAPLKENSAWGSCCIVITKASRRQGWRSDPRTKWVLGGVGGGDVPQWGLGAEISWGRGGGQMERKLVCFGGSVMRMMQGFLADDASDAHVFGKEPLPIVGENVIKTCIIWRAGDANDASI